MNRALGGSTTADQIQLDVMNAIVVPHDPRVLVYYCGSNDLNDGTPPESIRDGFVSWSAEARRQLNNEYLQFVFVSINKAPQKQPVWRELDRTNELVKDYCTVTPGHMFVDVNPLFFVGDQGNSNPRFDLFREDGLHFRPEAYEVMMPTVREAVFRAWKQALQGEKERVAKAQSAG